MGGWDGGTIVGKHRELELGQAGANSSSNRSNSRRSLEESVAAAMSRL